VPGGPADASRAAGAAAAQRRRVRDDRGRPPRGRPPTDDNAQYDRPSWATLTRVDPVAAIADYSNQPKYMAARYTTAEPHGFYTGQTVTFANVVNETFATGFTLLAEVDASDGTISVDDLGSMLATDWLVIGSEWMTVAADDQQPGDGTLAVNRGQHGTTAAAHASGAAGTRYPQSVYASDGVARAKMAGGPVGPVVVTSATTFESIHFTGTAVGADTADAWSAGQVFGAGSQAGYDGSRIGISYEDAFAFAASCGVDPWISIPFAADEACVTAIAEKTRDSVVPPSRAALESPRTWIASCCGAWPRARTGASPTPRPWSGP
jgi:hypothetical protein